MQSIIKSSDIKFHNADNKFEETIMSGFPNDILFDESTHFGILQFKLIDKASMHNFKQIFAILFNVDCSASMNDLSSDGRTKIQHVIHTLKRILSHFSELNQLYGLPIFVSVIAFDDKIHEIFDFIQITAENVELLKKKISKLEPLESTNLELALKEAMQICHTYNKKFPSHYLHHVLLTDGDATEGEVRHDILSKLVNKNYPNTFVGFGKSHNAPLLSHLSNNIRGDYRFIDNIEYSSIVYAEIIQNIIYNIIDIGRIVVKNGLIYDWKLNKWTNEISIANLSGSCEKTYQITAPDIYEIEIEIYGCLSDINSSEEKLLDTVCYYPALFDMEAADSKNFDVDLTPYAFRQKTQELMFEANELSINNLQRGLENYEYEISLKHKLKRFLKFMIKYIETAEKKNDKFMKLLCDDIYVTFNALGNEESTMWIHNRQSSQGRQQTYKATPSRAEILRPPKLHRQKYHEYISSPVRTRRFSNSSVDDIDLSDKLPDTINLYDSKFCQVTNSVILNDYYDNSYNFLQDLSYNQTIVPPFIPFPIMFNDAHNDNESEITDDSIDNYELSNSIDTPYITDEIIYMMSKICGEENIIA